MLNIEEGWSERGEKSTGRRSWSDGKEKALAAANIRQTCYCNDTARCGQFFGVFEFKIFKKKKPLKIFINYF